MRLAARNNNTKPMTDNNLPLFNGVHYFQDIAGLPSAKNVKYTVQIEATLVKLVAHTSPRLRQLAALLYDTTKRGEKSSVWCSFPFSQTLVYAYLKMLSCNVSMFGARLDQAERASLIHAYNTATPDSVQILVCSYDVGGVGLNLHKASHILILFDPPSVLARLDQVIGRGYRLGQHWDVYVFSIFMEDTHDRWAVNRCFGNALTSMHANLDKNELTLQTGAVCPEGQDPGAFAASLKANLDGFYFSKEAAPALRLRHETSFPLIESNPQMISGEGTDDKDVSDTRAGWRDIPFEYRLLNPREVLRYLFQRITGVKVPSFMKEDEDYHTFHQSPHDDTQDCDGATHVGDGTNGEKSKKRKLGSGSNPS